MIEKTRRFGSNTVGAEAAASRPGSGAARTGEQKANGVPALDGVVLCRFVSVVPDDQHPCCCLQDIIGDGSELVGFEDADNLRHKPFGDPVVASKTKRALPGSRVRHRCEKPRRDRRTPPLTGKIHNTERPVVPFRGTSAEAKGQPRPQASRTTSLGTPQPDVRQPRYERQDRTLMRLSTHQDEGFLESNRTVVLSPLLPRACPSRALTPRLLQLPVPVPSIREQRRDAPRQEAPSVRLAVICHRYRRLRPSEKLIVRGCTGRCGRSWCRR